MVKMPFTRSSASASSMVMPRRFGTVNSVCTGSFRKLPMMTFHRANTITAASAMPPASRSIFCVFFSSTGSSSCGSSRFGVTACTAGIYCVGSSVSGRRRSSMLKSRSTSGFLRNSSRSASMASAVG